MEFTIPSAPRDPELDSLYAAITGRKAFSYNAAADPLYRAAADRYIQNGRLAMRDTVGQAAALTGGYGNTYAQTAGQQRYDEYLRGLAEAIPQYYSLAFRQYQAQGEALRDAYDLARQRDADAYAREQDAYARERQDAADAAAREQRDYARRQDAYRQLYQLIAASGYQPTDEELSAAGMTRPQAQALRNQYLQAHAPKSSGGGYRGGSSAKKDKDKDKDKTEPVPLPPLTGLPIIPILRPGKSPLPFIG